jgi:hypothetical protein
VLRNHLVYGGPFLVVFSSRSSWISVFERAAVLVASGATVALRGLAARRRGAPRAERAEAAAPL